MVRCHKCGRKVHNNVGTPPLAKVDDYIVVFPEEEKPAPFCKKCFLEWHNYVIGAKNWTVAWKEFNKKRKVVFVFR
jgi:hypothetical protein